MKTFITDDFLLYNETAKRLYHDVAKDMPIIDYHNHLNQEEILQDKNYNNLYDIWLSGDHYKWRAMRANGIDEAYITGDKEPFEKFLAWAETVPHTIGNPLYHWTHLELLHYFGIDELLNKESAPYIWEEVNKQLADSSHSVRSLLKKDKVRFIGTTDDPTDDLNTHIALHDENFDVRVSPSFRTDRALEIESPEYTNCIASLAAAADMKIDHYADFLQAMERRVSFFDMHGCRSSDHSMSVMFYEEAREEEVAGIFRKRLNGQDLSDKEIEKFKTYTLISLGKMYAKKGWAMQLHLGPLRNNNTHEFKLLGANAGYDSIGDPLLARKLSQFLDALERENQLPKTILYSVNRADYHVLAAMAGNFQNAEVVGKVQFGTAWWFNDTIDGMENQLKTLANTGLIHNFIGMLTDSRSFLSFSRHEYFRRILCNLIGSWVEEGKAPKDMSLLSEYVGSICYYNAERYFNLK